MEIIVVLYLYDGVINNKITIVYSLNFVPFVDILSQVLYYTVEVNHEKEKCYKFNKIPC